MPLFRDKTLYSLDVYLGTFQRATEPYVNTKLMHGETIFFQVFAKQSSILTFLLGQNRQIKLLTSADVQAGLPQHLQLGLSAFHQENPYKQAPIADSSEKESLGWKRQAYASTSFLYFSISISPRTLILKSTPSTKAWKSDRDSIISERYCSPSL